MILERSKTAWSVRFSTMDRWHQARRHNWLSDSWRSDGQDYQSTVRTASELGDLIGKQTGSTIVTIASQVVGILGTFIRKNQDDTPGGVAVEIANVGGQIVVEEAAPGTLRL